MGWIKPRREPEEGENILFIVADHTHLGVALCIGKKMHYCSDNGECFENVDYWMPTPKPPKE